MITTPQVGRREGGMRPTRSTWPSTLAAALPAGHSAGFIRDAHLLARLPYIYIYIYIYPQVWNDVFDWFSQPGATSFQTTELLHIISNLAYCWNPISRPEKCGIIWKRDTYSFHLLEKKHRSYTLINSINLCKTSRTRFSLHFKIYDVCVCIYINIWLVLFLKERKKKKSNLWNTFKHNFVKSREKWIRLLTDRSGE